eukprot:6470223-Amphidinium_carterae.2
MTCIHDIRCSNYAGLGRETPSSGLATPGKSYCYPGYKSGSYQRCDIETSLGNSETIVAQMHDNGKAGAGNTKLIKERGTGAIRTVAALIYSHAQDAPTDQMSIR